MSTLVLIMVAIEVAAEPIIWFIASATADNSNSVNSSFSGVPSPPIIKLAITLASCTSSNIKLTPVKPSLNSTVVATLGALMPSIKSLKRILVTRGVVIDTRWFKIEDKVVAAWDMEILPTSPIKSLLACSSNPLASALTSLAWTWLASELTGSSFVSAGFSDSAVAPPFIKASISAWDRVSLITLLLLPSYLLILLQIDRCLASQA